MNEIHTGKEAFNRPAKKMREESEVCFLKKEVIEDHDRPDSPPELLDLKWAFRKTAKALA